MARLQQYYKDTVAPELAKKFGYKSVMEIPRITKVTLNMGVGEAVAARAQLSVRIGQPGGEESLNVAAAAAICLHASAVSAAPETASTH